MEIFSNLTLQLQIFNTSTSIISGAAVVVTDMSLAMISVFFNLVVITSIRRREEMVSVTFNLVIIKI